MKNLKSDLHRIITLLRQKFHSSLTQNRYISTHVVSRFTFLEINSTFLESRVKKYGITGCKHYWDTTELNVI